MVYSELLKDPRWQRKRAEILQRDDFTCRSCLNTKETLNVHHIKYVGLPWECPDKFLITLCETCHEREESLKFFEWYKIIAESGISRQEFLALIEHVNYYMSFVDPRDVSSFNDILAKIVPDGNLVELIESRRKNNGRLD